MIMKVFNKGQVVIPARVRRELGIDIGDMLDVTIDEKHRSIELHKIHTSDAKRLAGSLAGFAKRRRFPSRRKMDNALREGLSRET